MMRPITVLLFLASANAVSVQKSATQGYARALAIKAEHGDQDAIETLEKQDPELMEKILEEQQPVGDHLLYREATSLKRSQRKKALMSIIKRRPEEPEVWENFQEHEHQKISDIGDVLNTIRVCASGLQAWATDWKERVTIINLTPDSVRSNIHSLMQANVPLPPAFYFLLEQLVVLSKVVSYHLAFILSDPVYFKFQTHSIDLNELLSKLGWSMRKIKVRPSPEKEEEQVYQEMLAKNPKPGSAWAWISDVAYEVMADGSPTDNAQGIIWPFVVRAYNATREMWQQAGTDEKGQKLKAGQSLQFPDIKKMGQKLRQQMSGNKFSDRQLDVKFRKTQSKEMVAQLQEMNGETPEAEAEVGSFLEMSDRSKLANLSSIQLVEQGSTLDSAPAAKLPAVFGAAALTNMDMGAATLRAMQNLTNMVSGGKPLFNAEAALKKFRAYEGDAQKAYSAVLNFRELLHATGSGVSDLIDRQTNTLDNMKCVEGEIESMQDKGIAFLPKELKTAAGLGVEARSLWMKFADIFNKPESGYFAYSRLLAFITNFLSVTQVALGGAFAPTLPLVQSDVLDDYMKGDYKEDIVSFFKFYDPKKYGFKAPTATKNATKPAN